MLALVAIAAPGCDDVSSQRSARVEPSGSTGPGERGATSSFTATDKMSGAVIDASASLGPQAPAPEQQAREKTSSAAENEPKATTGRKIVYNANIDLVTENLNTFESSLTKIVSKQKAYIADSERSGATGTTRHGFWKVRVPVDGYDDFINLTLKLGELVSIKADSQDVSEEYYDLDARQTAKRVEEARLLKHLSDSTGKLEEILAVERELSRVRGEIERMQGRLRVLTDLTTLATVTVNANEIKGYVPPQAPTFSTRIARTFATSLASLQQFGEGLLLCLVALAPWLPFIAIPVVLIVWLTRRSSRGTATIAPGGIGGRGHFPEPQD
jgi:hypothetical protein